MPRSRRAWYLALLSGALLAIAMPPLPTGPLAWVALVPLLIALERTSPRRAAALGYAAGMAYHLGALYWVAYHTAIPRWLAIISWILASIILSFYTAAATAGVRLAARWAGRRWVWTLPPIWVATEYARYTTEFAFPWSTIGHTQARLLGFIQQADLWGILGVSFWVCVLNVVAWHAVSTAATSTRRAWQHAAIFALIVFATLTYGRWRLSEEPTGTVEARVALVQPNIDMETKWESGTGLARTRDILAEQTLAIPPGSVDLVIWPETAIPDYLIYAPPGDYRNDLWVISPNYWNLLNAITTTTGAPLAMGTPAYDYRTDVPYNSAALVLRDSMDVQLYRKRLLVPFGERVPYDRMLGFLEQLNLGIAHWAPGDGPNVLHANGMSFGVAICFESIFPGLMREFVRNGADFLVVVTNDAWFGRSSLPWQHAEFGAFRAIETRTWIARTANTGISEFIDPWGRVIDRTRVFERKTLVGSVGPREGDTLYLRFGDWIAQASAAFAVAAVLAGIVAGRRKR